MSRAEKLGQHVGRVWTRDRVRRGAPTDKLPAAGDLHNTMLDWFHGRLPSQAEQRQFVAGFRAATSAPKRTTKPR